MSNNKLNCDTEIQSLKDKTNKDAYQYFRTHKILTAQDVNAN